jgi:hypothetical protein
MNGTLIIVENFLHSSEFRACSSESQSGGRTLPFILAVVGVCAADLRGSITNNGVEVYDLWLLVNPCSRAITQHQQRLKTPIVGVQL